MNSAREIVVARDYATHPIGRERANWPVGGERFRQDFLEPPLFADEHLIVDLRGTRGLAPSFLEEAFGGLIDAGLPLETLERLLVVRADDAARVDQIWRYIRRAAELSR